MDNFLLSSALHPITKDVLYLEPIMGT